MRKKHKRKSNRQKDVHFIPSYPNLHSLLTVKLKSFKNFSTKPSRLDNIKLKPTVKNCKNNPFKFNNCLPTNSIRVSPVF